MQAPEVLGGRYELRGVLGRGGMAEVREGWDTRLDRAVAVKLLYPVFTAQPDNRRRFETEARAAAALNHPHIVAVHDSGEHRGTPFIVMERLSGRTLADLLAGGPLPQAHLRSILDDVLSALAAAHAAGILHRDIKPANVLFTTAGDVKVADFGLAKSGDVAHTMTGQIVGTMGYLSADRLAGRPASVADDLYAVGVVGYEALAGSRPFPQQNLPALARAIAEDQPPPVMLLRPDVDPELAAVVERAMARDPRWRFPSADAMRAALSGAPQPNPVRPPTRVLAAPLPPPTTMVVAAPVRSQTKTLLAVAAVLAAIALAAVLVLFDSGQRPSVPEPVGTSSSVPTPAPVSSPSPPPPPAPPMQVDEGPPGKKGPGPKKPKGPRGDDDD
ncbi:MAG: protein kinase domain-containing protein [Mycobacterium sp.]